MTEEENKRRCQLVDKEIDAGLTTAEALELSRLQDKFMIWRQSVAPLPIESARQLLDDCMRDCLDPIHNLQYAIARLNTRHWVLFACDNGYGCEIFNHPGKGEQQIGLGFAKTIPMAIHKAIMSIGEPSEHRYHY